MGDITESTIFSVKVSIVAETISCDDKSDVFLLTKKDKDFLPLLTSSSRSKATSLADLNNILTENVVDNNKAAVTKNNI